MKPKAGGEAITTIVALMRLFDQMNLKTGGKTITMIVAHTA